MQNIFLLALVVSAILVAYSWKKIKNLQQENPDNIEINEDYQKFSKIKKKAVIACVVCFLLGNFFSTSDKDLVEEQAKKNIGVHCQLLKNANGSNYDIKCSINDIKVNGEEAMVFYTVYEYNFGKQTSSANQTMKFKKVNNEWKRSYN